MRIKILSSAVEDLHAGRLFYMRRDPERLRQALETNRTEP